MNKGRRPTVSDDYYAKRLAEPWLLDIALLLDVNANEEPLAVPVGKLRRGGHIEFCDRPEAEKAVMLLTGRDGFPAVRLIEYEEKGKPPDYFEVRWGDPPPFDGCDYAEPICGLLLGLHYGYKEEVIAELVRVRMNEPRRHFTKKGVINLIRSAMNPR